MTVKTILTEPNKILRQVSLPVEKIGKEEQVLMDDMLETMYMAKGIGLAAIQVGVPKRIIVIDIGIGVDIFHFDAVNVHCIFIKFEYRFNIKVIVII